MLVQMLKVDASGESEKTTVKQLVREHNWRDELTSVLPIQQSLLFLTNIVLSQKRIKSQHMNFFFWSEFHNFLKIFHWVSRENIKN